MTGWRRTHGELRGSVDAKANTTGTSPGFVDIEKGNLRLERSSPCIDRGVELPKALARGHPVDKERAPDGGAAKRKDSGRPDIGAYTKE